MTRAQVQQIEALENQIRGLRGTVSELRAEARGEGRGTSLVADQLVRDIRLGATREEQHRAAAARAYGDVQRVLHVVAAHVLDCRSLAPEVVQMLEDALACAGISLRPALIAVQVERSEAAARVTAAEAAAAVATAPVPPRT